MTEVPHPGRDHGDAGLVGGRDHLGVAHRAARLDDGGGAGLDDLLDPVLEREEGVGADRRSPSRRAPPSSRRSSPTRPGSSGRRRWRRSGRPSRTRWRSTSRASRPSRRRAGPSTPARVGARFVITLQSSRRTRPRSRSMTSRPPGIERSSRASSGAALPGGARPRRGAAPRGGAGSSSPRARRGRRRRRTGAMTHSRKRLGQLERRRVVHGPVQRDDAAEGRDRVAGARAGEGLGDGRRRGPRRTACCA